MSYITVRTIIEVVSFSRYSCKLFIYLATGRQFRKQLKGFSCRKKMACQTSETTMTSIASRANSYKRQPEKMKLLSLGRLAQTESTFTKFSSSPTASPAQTPDSCVAESLALEANEMSPPQTNGTSPPQTNGTTSPLNNNNNNYKFN